MLEPRGRVSYFQKREGFNPASMLRNPTVLIREKAIGALGGPPPGLQVVHPLGAFIRTYMQCIWSILSAVSWNNPWLRGPLYPRC